MVVILPLLSSNENKKLNQNIFLNFKFIKPGFTTSTVSNSLKLCLIKSTILAPTSNGFILREEDNISGALIEDY